MSPKNEVNVLICQRRKHKSKLVHSHRLTKSHRPGEYTLGYDRRESLMEKVTPQEEEEVDGSEDWMMEEPVTSNN